MESPAIQALRNLSASQRHTLIASFLGWSFDAFDFFVLVFVLHPLAAEFGTSVATVSWAIFLTLAARPLGALLFGRLADRYGRRPILMLNIAAYSILELASAAAPDLATMLVLRGLYGVAMGGMWGIAASLTFETIPTNLRGLVSGILQQGYAVGYLTAAAAFGLLYPLAGWRGMFAVGAAPALLIPYIWLCVPESRAWQGATGAAARVPGLLRAVVEHWPTVLFMVVLMTAFNFLSHGTQDLYPTFLSVQHRLPPSTVSAIAIFYNCGAILGGTTCGYLSQRLGRRRTIAIAALLVLPIVPLWAFSSAPAALAIGAFLMQVMVQGAWGVVPVHLNELSPDGVRGTLPGLVYQLGNLFAAANATIQARIAQYCHGDYAVGLALVASLAAVAIALVAGFGKEAKDRRFGAAL